MTLRPAAALRQHVLDLARAFDVRVVETTEVPPEGAAAAPRQRVIVVAPIHDETLYAVALHELGHILAPAGWLPGVEGDRLRIKVAEEEAAWEWARHYALEWTPVMEQVAAWGFASYTEALQEQEAEAQLLAALLPPPPTITDKRVPWEQYETKPGRVQWSTKTGGIKW